MTIVRASEFRSNQGKFMMAAQHGECVMIESRYGTFRLVPVSTEPDFDDIIREGLQEIQQMNMGVLPKTSARDFLNEL